MPVLMGEVVFDEKAQGDRGVAAYGALGGKALFGDAVDDGGENLMFGLPPAQQGFPVLRGIAVGGDPAILGIPGAGVDAIESGADKALAVVGSGVEQVADDLFAGPASGAPGDVSEGG